jgi:hypothetical protein
MSTRFLGSLLMLSALGVAASATAGRAQPSADPIDPDPRLAFRLGANRRFGLTVLKDAAGKAVNKRLTYSVDGSTNSTVVRIDGKDVEFGSAAGKWLAPDAKLADGVKSVWAVGNIHVTQILEIVPSKQPVAVAAGARKRLLNTCLVRFVIENHDTQEHNVGLRIQLDTLIGINDGVPFAVPGHSDLVATKMDFPSAKQVPDFVQALERPNLRDPGTVGHMTLKIGGLEPPSRVSLTHWPGATTIWEVPMVDIGGDSAVVIYWDADHVLKPKEQRSLGFAYGLGAVSSSAETDGKLALTINGSFAAGEPFTVTAYVQKPAKDQTLTLELPAGLVRVTGKATEAVPPPAKGSSDTSILTWNVTAPKPGQFDVKVRSSSGIAQDQMVTIHAQPSVINTGPGTRPGTEPSHGPKSDPTILDARRALQMSVGNLAQDLQLDVDRDGRVTSRDAGLILDLVAAQARKGK